MNYIVMVTLLTGNIDLIENALAINPFADKLYAIGTGTKSGMSNLYIIDISSP